MDGAPCTLQVKLQNTLNKNNVTRWQPFSKTDIKIMYQSVEAWESQLKQHICNTTVLRISKKYFKHIQIDDLAPGCSTHKYVDDITMSEILATANSPSHMANFLHAVMLWADKNDMIINTNKTKELVIGP